VVNANLLKFIMVTYIAVTNNVKHNHIITIFVDYGTNQKR
jgi:hypothetical protein